MLPFYYVTVQFRSEFTTYKDDKEANNGSLFPEDDCSSLNPAISLIPIKSMKMKWPHYAERLGISQLQL